MLLAAIAGGATGCQPSRSTFARGKSYDYVDPIVREKKGTSDSGVASRLESGAGSRKPSGSGTTTTGDEARAVTSDKDETFFTRLLGASKPKKTPVRTLPLSDDEAEPAAEPRGRSLDSDGF